MIYIASRLVRSVVVILGVVILVFCLLRLAPGDPATLLLGQNPSEADLVKVRALLGLDQPILIQLATFLVRVAQGEFGDSLLYRRPVIDLVFTALPATITLAVAALVVSLLISVPAGVIMAVHRGSGVEMAIRGCVLVSQSLPTFWIGIMLILFFSVHLQWLPTSGDDGWRHLILPAITLSTYQWAMLARVVRAGMLDVLNQDYVRTAHAKGLPPRLVIIRHALRNTLIPVVTIAALQLGAMLSGAVITEAVFAWPGLGSLAVAAINSRDYPVLQGVVIVSAVAVVSLNMLADAAYVVLDPRVRK
jgi:ABC-type dipeptide/oligopeptide/nickel transport system permease component